ncbi:MAG: CBS domain-containing protein [Acidobacteriota bacterium]|nr:CBS domain-containing protein [Acidobacteriota bacterium]MDE3170395.1 CBS domain-containing protein [Acidobacteriota bacterium]
MKVADVMMGTPASCTETTNLAAAVEILWERNCGILPVVNPDGKVTGVVTDRDICIALGTRNRPAAEITVAEVQPAKLFVCKADDDIHSALATMSGARVRRLPVLDGNGKLQGILSLDDVVLHAISGGAGRIPDELSSDEVIEHMKRVYQSALPAVARSKSAAA